MNRLSTRHPLDHLVLPTRDLAVARARLTALGFNVAPPGVHPFGTENACVYFADGTFMEPLAVADRAAVAHAVGEGNVFVARDSAFRDRNGDEGFSAVVFGTDDADTDHRRYVEAGFSAGKRLDFSRPFIDAAGNSDTAAFRLAFVALADAPDAFVFACERVNAPNVDRSALQAHANGAVAITEIVAISDDPTGPMRLLESAAGNNLAGTDAGNTVALPNARLTLVDRPEFASRFGAAAAAPTGLRFAAVVFAVPRLERIRHVLEVNGVSHRDVDGDLVVQAAPGQGAVFAFREMA